MTLHDPIHLRATEDFIKENPVVVRPGRRSKIPTGTGGFTLSDPVEQASIVVRKIGINSVTANQERTTPDGQVVSVSANIVAMPDADIQINDIIDIEDVKFNVVTLSFDPPWRLRAEVYVRG